MTGNWAKARGFVWLLAALTIAGMGIFLLQQPDRYEATTRVSVDTSLTNYFDFAFVDKPRDFPGQFDTNALRYYLSQPTLWGTRYTTNTISEAEAVEFFKKDIRFTLTTNGTAILVDITATGENPLEATKIADAIADGYCRSECWSRTNIGDILRLQEQQALQRFAVAKAEYDKWTNTPAVTASSSREAVENYASYQQAKTEYEKADKETFMFRYGTGLMNWWGSPASILNKASLPDFPVGPDRLPGKILIAISLFLCVAGGLSLWRLCVKFTPSASPKPLRP